MRIKIETVDRIGISQEILALLAAHHINVKAVEIEVGLVYIHLANSPVAFDAIKKHLLSITDVKQCQLIDLMPAEQRAKHLSALLAKIPDAIFDIDTHGIILAVNDTAQTLLQQPRTQIIGQPLSLFLPQLKLVDLKQSQVAEITLNNVAYIAELTPIQANQTISGAIIMLRSISQVGRQISLIQATDKQSLDNIIGDSAGINQLKAITLKYAQLSLPVLITGETGTGKELFARAIHEASPRAKQPFLAINCAALPENLLESELFGYAAGAFTGAQRGGKPGLFELADGGTVFLDEIGDMSGYLQAKLLRFLQDFNYRRVGGSREIKSNVRIISATHKNLVESVKSGSFRDDLYYRLNVLQLDIPPLRARLADIPALCQFFLNRAAIQTAHNVPQLSEQAITALKTFHWPGNIRQLQNCLFRLVAVQEKPLITAEDIADVLQHGEQTQKTETLGQKSEQSGAGQFDETLVESWQHAQQQFERNLLTQLYPLYPSTRKLAKRLAVSHNKIAMKLKQYGLTV